ncbi:MAG: histidine kinase [Candidatus Dormibacteria bacterium]|jgi:two-component system NarL family sensor kinase
MRRPRLALSLFNPRRRLRDRLLATMLVVALVPAAAFFVLTAVSLHGITQTTVNRTNSSIIQHQEGAFQTGLDATASTAIEAHLQTLSATVEGLAGQLSAQSGSTSASPSPSATTSPSASATPSPPAATAPSGASTPVGAPQTQPLGDGVDAIMFPDSSATAELLVGMPAGSTEPVLTRAARLAALSKFATVSMVKAAAKVTGIDVDAVWVMDPQDEAVWVSPGGVSLPQEGGAGLAQNPQGIPLSLLDRLYETPPTSTPTWTTPYQNPLHGGDWEETVYSLDQHGLVVGADVPLAQFAGVISQAPAQAGSYPLLLDNDTNQVIAAPPATAAKDFTGPLVAGKALPAPEGKQGRSVLADLEYAEGGATFGAPIEGVVRGVERLYFVAGVGDPRWTLVDSVPAANFQPSSSALKEGINSALTSVFQGALWIVAILLLVSFLLATLLSRFVVAPVRALTVSAERLAEGRTDEEVPPQGRDEVGDLAASLERMRKEINASREVILAASRELEQKVATRTAELSVRNEELLALNELAGSLTRSLDPEAILAGALEAVRSVLPTTGGHGYRLNREGILVPSRAEPAERSPALEEVASAAITANQLVTRPDGDSVLIGLPMGTGAGPLGGLGLRAAVAPGAEMTALLMAIGNQVGLALSTARLSDEGREMAVLEERTRLAREIHDTLAQQLTGIVIQLEAAQALVSRDPERSIPALASAQELARSALAEARRSVWDLRPAPLASTGLISAAEKEVERFRHRTGIGARLRAEHMAPPPALRPQSEVTLLRITQQALANIAAHSGASRVTVRLRNLGDHVELTVKDNGHGFDTSALPPGSFGIVGMSERARIAGGTFQVESAPGRGTTITVDLPVSTDAGVAAAPPRAAVPV